MDERLAEITFRNQEKGTIYLVNESELIDKKVRISRIKTGEKWEKLRQDVIKELLEYSGESYFTEEITAKAVNRADRILSIAAKRFDSDIRLFIGC